MPTDDSGGLYTPVNLGGLLARIAETADGGARSEIWSGKAWVPSDGATDCGEIMAGTPASDAFLARKGVPLEEKIGSSKAKVVLAAHAALVAERVEPGWKLRKWLWVMIILSLSLFVTFVVAISPWK